MFALIPYDVWLAAAIAVGVEFIGGRPSCRVSRRRRNYVWALRLYRCRDH